MVQRISERVIFVIVKASIMTRFLVSTSEYCRPGTITQERFARNILLGFFVVGVAFIL